jgi:putative oxidoreductase
MRPILGRFSGPVYAVLRFVAGAMFACHGAQKLFGAFGAQPMTDKPLMLAAAVIEFFGGLLIALGLAGSYAAFVASGEMAVAYFMAHASSGSFWPIVNKGELAVLYCFVFLYVAAHGSGEYSLDAAMAKKRT